MNRARYDALMRRRGRAMTLGRPSTGGAPVTYTNVTIYGKLFSATGEELVGDLVQHVRRVKLGNAEIEAAVWPGPPRPGDRVTVGSKVYTVEYVDTRDDGGVVWQHVLGVKG